MAVPWDRDNNRERGHISELPMGGLLSELLASEGVDPSEFEGVDSIPPLLALDTAVEPERPEPALPEAALPASAPLSPNEASVALPGLAAQLWALNEAASASHDEWPSPEVVAVAGVAEPEPLPALHPETHEFAIPGLLFSLTEAAAEPESEPEVQAEPAPDGQIEPALVQADLAAAYPPAAIVREPEIEPEPELLVLGQPLPHSRSNDLSNLIGAIDNELATAPDLPPVATQEADKTHERFVVFRLGGISYGLHMRLVREVERVGRVTPVPGGPRLICGLINLRGEILPLIDPRLLLGSAPADWPPSGYLVVVQPDPEEQPVALLVDELGGVALVDPAAVDSDLADLGAELSAHTLGMVEHRGRLVLLLDHRKLLTAEALLASSAHEGSN